MSKRVTISKKIRFEVFKRDKFTCQYCGKKSPDVILHIDHIVPVSKKGTNDLLNLATSCVDCNLGKSDRQLKDDSIVNSQRSQAELIEEMNQQKKMMAKWITGLSDQLHDYTKILTDYILKEHKVRLSEYGQELIKKTIKKYGVNETKIAIDLSAECYLKNYEDQEQRTNFIIKIERICHYRQADKKDPEGAEIRRLVNISAKVWSYCNRGQAKSNFESYRRAGYKISQIERAIVSTRSMYGFEQKMEILNGH